MLQLNNVTEGLLYLQISRGVADRDFAFPQNPKSSLVMFTQVKSLLDSPTATTGIKIVTIPDIRWKRRDIKTVGLLAPSLGKQTAIEAGADDAWMVEDGFITEGTSNNTYIVRSDRVIQTRHLGNEILSGITRDAVLRFAREANYDILEEPFTVDDAKQAQEAFITSASSFVTPVVSIDEVLLGDGNPGPVSTELRKIYIETALAREDL